MTLDTLASIYRNRAGKSLNKRIVLDLIRFTPGGFREQN
jgi:hypothetical protein